MSAVTQPANSTAVNNYETDFYNWTQETAEKIQQHRFHDIDIDALAEEIEGLGRSDRSSVFSALTQLIAHLLKGEYQPDYRRRAGDANWRISIVKLRLQIARNFKHSPILVRYSKEDLADVYADALKLAQAESGLIGVFPTECPYTYSQILDETFFPEANPK